MDFTADINDFPGCFALTVAFEPEYSDQNAVADSIQLF